MKVIIIFAFEIIVPFQFIDNGINRKKISITPFDEIGIHKTSSGCKIN